MANLTSLRNIGPQSAHWLESVGIHTPEELFGVGIVEAYLLVKAAFPERVSLNLLFALQGALMDLSWNELPPEMKESLVNKVEEASKN